MTDEASRVAGGREIGPRLKIVVRRKPEPEPLAVPDFECVVCQRSIKRDPYQPEWEIPPICNACSWHTPTRPQLAWASIDQWSHFRRAHALLCAIEQETKRARLSQ